MKKIFCSLAILTLALSSIAQVNKVYNFTGITFGAIKDSIIAASTTDTMIIHSQHFAESVSIQPIVTKVSGTINGQVALTASVDGINWVVPLAADTLHVANATTSTTIWTLSKNPYSYYRIITSTLSGTQKIYIKCLFMPNKQSGLTNGVYNMLTPYSTVKDSVTNTGSGTLTLQVQNWYEVVTMQINAHKISGTVAGTITLQGSNDGTNFIAVPTTYIKTGAHSPGVFGGVATATATDVTDQSFAFTVFGSPFEYYRFSWTGSGTMLATQTAKLFPNK